MRRLKRTKAAPSGLVLSSAPARKSGVSSTAEGTSRLHLFPSGRRTYKSLFSSNQNQKREFIEVIARAAAEDDESGAIGLSTLFSAGKKVWDLISGRSVANYFVRLTALIYPLVSSSNQQQSRDFVNILARAAVEDDESGAFGLSTLFSAGKKVWDLFSGRYVLVASCVDSRRDAHSSSAPTSSPALSQSL